MRYKTIEYVTIEPVGYLYLNRPEALNAINEQMEVELADVLEEVAGDGRVKALVVSSLGDQAFSVGIETEGRPGGVAEAGPAVAQRSRRGLADSAVWESLANLPKPTIAAIRGSALGAGLELALACDIRVASEDATFGFPEVSLGLIPSHGGTQRLPRIVGRARAIEMILSGQEIDAGEAVRVELVSRVVPADDLLAVAGEMASKLATYGPVALAYAREAVNRGMDMTFNEGLHLEMDLYALLQTTEDRDEGIRSFKEKRRPEFQGR